MKRCIKMIERRTWNVVQLSLGFFFIFSAFNSQGAIEETVINNSIVEGVTIKKHDGYISLALIYLSFTVSNFVTPPVIHLLGVRLSLVFGGFAYVLFELGFLFLNRYYLFASSVILGLGAAVIWSSQGSYLALNNTDEIEGKKHTGIFWAISQASVISGGIFLCFVFDGDDPNKTLRRILGGERQNQGLPYAFLYAVFTGVSLLGVIILALLRVSPRNLLQNTDSELGNDGSNSQTEGQDSYIEIMKSAMRLAITKPMMKMFVIFMFTGISLTFWSSVYPTCIASTVKLGKQLIGLYMIFQGVGQGVAGLVFGILNVKISRQTVIFVGTFANLLAFFATFINIPFDAPFGKTDKSSIIEPSKFIALICGFALGFADGCWNTQVFAFLLDNYSDKSAQAFSIFKFFQSLMASVAFLYAEKLVLHWQLIILSIGSILSCFAFISIERSRNIQIQHEEPHVD